MKRAVTRTLIALPLIAAVAAGGAWYVLSGKLLERVRGQIEAINVAQHPEGQALSISYGALERAPFPIIGARIVDLSGVFNDAGGGADNRAPISVKFTRKGNIDYVEDVIRNEYRLHLDGSSTSEISVGEQQFTIASEPSDVKLALSARDRTAFKQLAALDLKSPDALKNAVKVVSGATIESGALKYTDTTTGAMLYSQGASSLKLDNRTDDTHYDFDLEVALVASEVTPEYSEMLGQLIRATHLTFIVDDSIVPFSATRAGKQDVDVALSVSMPRHAAQGPIDTGHVVAERFAMKNDFYTLNAPFAMVFDMQDGVRFTTIKADWSFELSEKGGAEMQDLGLNSGLMMVLTRTAGAETSQAEPEKLQEKLNAALPNLSTLGPITFKADMVISLPSYVKAPKDMEASEIRENMTINALNLNHARWGIDLQGMAGRAGKNGMTVDFTLVCKKCTTLTADSFETAMAMQEVMLLINPAHQAWMMNEQTHANLDRTLAEIGQVDSASGDITFSIGSAGSGEVRINNKPFAEVMPKLLAAFMLPGYAGAVLPDAGPEVPVAPGQ